MAISRRHLIQATACSGLLPLLSCTRKKTGMLIGGYRQYGNHYGVASVTTEGASLWSLEAPARVHDIAVQTHHRLAAVVARRPGTFVLIVEMDSGILLHKLTAPARYIFEGHALWQDNYLWISASERENGKGILLGYRFDHWESPESIIELPGVGPHQILSFNTLLVVALGGWRTEDRDVLNRETFQSFLALVNPQTSQIHLLDSPHPDLSVRHLATDGKSVWAGLQYADPHPNSQPLIYQTNGQNWTAVSAPSGGWEHYSGYVASLAIAGSELLATTPHGHCYSRWNIATHQHVQTAPLLDAAAVASDGNEWFLGSGTGKLVTSHKSSRSTEFFWDNHWSFVPEPLQLS